MGVHLGDEVLLVGADQRVGLGSAQFGLREVGVHLVAVKVGVVRLAVGVVKPQDLRSRGQRVGWSCDLQGYYGNQVSLRWSSEIY